MTSRTREQLLNVAFEQFYRHGYYAVSLDMILATAKVSKGSMYHFFSSKKALMLAVIDEKLMCYIEDKYMPVLLQDRDLLDALWAVINDRDAYNLNVGCRVNNLVQELSHHDADFKMALERVYCRFEDLIAQVLQRAVEKKELQTPDVDSLAMFVVAGIEGSMATAKKSQQPALFNDCMLHLKAYLASFKTE